MASWKPKHCSYCVLLINNILCNEVVLYNKFTYIFLIIENIKVKPHLKSMLRVYALLREKSELERSIVINVYGIFRMH
jgi:hypothetical protein